jgi:tetratricopeptide (TPR) repeat protein
MLNINKVTIKLHRTFLLISLFSFSYAQLNDSSNEFSYALKLYNQNFYDLAAQQFIKYYNDYGKSENADEAKYYAGMSLFLLKDYNKSRIEFQSLALEYPKSQRAGESWFKIGECYELLGLYEEAAKSFETLKTLYPSDKLAGQALYHSGINFQKVKSYAKAKSVLSAVLENYPESPFYFKSMVQLALVNELIGDHEQARMHLAKVINTSKNNDELAHAHYTMGLLDYNQGYIESSEKSFLIVIKNHSKSSHGVLAALYLAKINIQKNNNAQTISYLESIDSRSLSEEALNEANILKGDAYFLSGKYALAEKSYQNSIQKVEKEDSLYTLVTLKLILSQKIQGLDDKAQNAILELTRSHENDKLSFEIVKLNLEWLEKAGKYDDGIGLLLQKLKSVQDEEQRHFFVSRLAEFYAATKRWRDLAREIKPYASSPVTTKYKDDFMYLLGVAYLRMQEYKESDYYFSTILNQYSASIHYDKAWENHLILDDYYLIDENATYLNIYDIFTNSLDREKSEMPLLIGKGYYNDVKAYSRAKIQFEKAVEIDVSNRGDAYLYLGKTMLKLAGMPDQNNPVVFQNQAAQYFQKAVENIATCSRPDEASWLMVHSKILVDTISISKQKSYIETLLKKYPDSDLIEDWMSELAYGLAFHENFATDAKKFFKELITNYKSSIRYPSYLFGYAKLIEETEPQNALTIFKTLALDYPNSPFAAQALQEVALHYENSQQFSEAVQLYSRLLEQYYYSAIAEEVQIRYGELNLKAGDNNKAVSILSENIDHPFLNDLVLSQEFLPPSVKNDLVYIGMANKRMGQVDQAKIYFKRYLTITSNKSLADVVFFELAEMYFDEGQIFLALENFDQISPVNTSLYNKALLYRADILYSLEEYEKAKLVYQELSKLYAGKPESVEIQGKYILCHIKTGAISQSEKLIGIYQKQFSDAYNYFASFTLELGEYHRKNKNFDKAVSYYKTVQSKYSKSEYVDDAHYYTALVNITLNKNKEAFAALTEFYGKFPKSDKIPYVQNTLGTLYYRVEKYDDAIVAFKNALQYSTEKELTRQIMGNLIKTYSLTSFWDAAQGLARQYIEEYPDAEDRLDTKMIIAQAFINLNQFQNAVDYLKRMKLEADSEKEPEIQFYIGEALLKAGQYEEAIAEFVKIPLLSKKTKLQWEASALYYSGQAYEKLGRINDAVRMYKEIINRPGIDLVLKRDAEKRISQIQG